MEMEGKEGSVEESHSSVDTFSSVAAKIKALDRGTSSHLRTSQIINKVSDIVRELVENSLDAAASTIRVYLDQFGKNKIEVRDNGHGLLSSEVTQIFQGGHTSKLLDTSNLSRGNFLGFKGEALNAICASGNVTVVSKRQNEDRATKYKFDSSGNVISTCKLAHGVGTMITVEKLFEKIPVRRQRLDNAGTGASELKDIEAYLKGVAVAYPKCHVSLYHNNTLLWSKASVQTIEQALCAVLGIGIGKKLGKVGPINVEVNDERRNKDENDVHRSLELYLPIKPVDMRTMSYTSNKMAMIFCNQKRVYIREFEKLIHRYVTSNVEKPQPSDQRRFPVSIVYIQVPPKEADFNLDMDKTKVLLVHKDKILDSVENALIEFYGVDLRNSIEESTSDETLPSDQNSTTPRTDQRAQANPEKSRSNISIHASLADGNNCSADKVHPVNLNTPSDPETSILSTPSTSHATRTTAIGDFLRDIPSTSLAFTQSPAKPMNEEPVSVAFPKSKIDTQPVGGEAMRKLNLTKKPGSSVVANFEISIGSQESPPDQETVNSKTNSINSELIQPSVSSEKFGQNDAESADKYKRWLQGRMTDRFGEIIESVVNVNESPTSNREDPESMFREALLAGSSKSRCSNANARSGLQPSPFSQTNRMEPPLKRMRDDTFGNGPQFLSPAVQCSTPRMSTHKQVTLDSFANWQTPTGGFSQPASTAVAGVRIPLTPHPSKAPLNTFVPRNSVTKTNENSLPKSVTLWEQQERQTYKQQSLTSSFQNTTNNSGFLGQSNTSMFSAKLTPKIHKEIQGGTCGQLYFAQTFDSIGVFSPLNMIEYFPSESRESWMSTLPNDAPPNEGALLLTLEDVSRMFQQFVLRTDINSAPVSGKIFHVLSKLPDLTKVMISK